MIGAILPNRYRIDAELGRGGMGVAYRAHESLRRGILKLPLASLSTMRTIQSYLT